MAVVTPGELFAQYFIDSYKEEVIRDTLSRAPFRLREDELNGIVQHALSLPDEYRMNTVSKVNCLALASLFSVGLAIGQYISTETNLPSFIYKPVFATNLGSPFLLLYAAVCSEESTREAREREYKLLAVGEYALFTAQHGGVAAELV